MIDRILSISAEERLAQEEKLSLQFSLLPGLKASQTILLYLSAFPEEIPTRGFFIQAQAMGKRILLPRIARMPRRLQLLEVSDLAVDLAEGPLGIAEPRPECPEYPAESVDWALIPGLAFDGQGYRLGRGGGYYDRLLPRLRADAICWGLGFNCQLVEEVPHEAHDAPLNGVSVPSRSLRGLRK